MNKITMSFATGILTGTLLFGGTAAYAAGDLRGHAEGYRRHQ